MYPDLSYFFNDLLGTPVDNWTSLFKTFGLLLAIAIFSAAWLFRLELKRKADEGFLKPTKGTKKTGAKLSIIDLVVNTLFGFLLGYKLGFILQNIEAFQTDASAVLLSNKGNVFGGIIGLLVLVGPILWRYWRDRDTPIREIETTIFPHDRIGEITIIAALFGIIGAKFFGVMEDPAAFAKRPLQMLFSGSGLAIYGGLIVGFLGSYWYLRRNNLPVKHMLDAVVPALLLGYAVGRLGCQFSGDGDWGIVNTVAQPGWWFLPDWLWAYHYPNNVTNQGVLMDICDPQKWQALLSNRSLEIEERCLEACGIRYCHELQPPVFPTPIYESITMLVLLLIVWNIRKRIRIAGMLFFIYLILNGVERFLIEKIRVNDTYDFLPFQPTQAEIISTLFVLTGLTGCYFLWKKEQAVQTSDSQKE